MILICRYSHINFSGLMILIWRFFKSTLLVLVILICYNFDINFSNLLRLICRFSVIYFAGVKVLICRYSDIGFACLSDWYCFANRLFLILILQIFWHLFPGVMLFADIYFAVIMILICRYFAIDIDFQIFWYKVSKRLLSDIDFNSLRLVRLITVTRLFVTCLREIFNSFNHKETRISRFLPLHRKSGVLQ